MKETGKSEEDRHSSLVTRHLSLPFLPFALLRASRHKDFFLTLALLLVVIFMLDGAARKEILVVGAAQDGGEKSAAMSFSYVFENKRFYIPLIEIDLVPDGSGELRFKRGESDDILERKLKLRPETLARIRWLVEDSQFLTSDEDYQHKKDFSHLGWMTITTRQGERERKVRFNYTVHPDMEELAAIFRGIATQEIHLFDIDLSQQYQPLDLPRQIEILENDLRLGRIAEPEGLIGPLREIANNDVFPLIARNRVKRVIESIEKKKYKSPVKSK
ncbi:MAG: hypothetical protein L0229_04445 [Blastocatellia bacterium]|nr:hypothetical protein [Blastocatellia bacterium]